MNEAPKGILATYASVCQPVPEVRAMPVGEPQRSHSFSSSCGWFECRDLPPLTSRETMLGHLDACHGSMKCPCGKVADYVRDNLRASEFKCASCGLVMRSGPRREAMLFG